MINVRKLKRKWENVSKNNKMIFLLLCCLCFITVGYAAINQVLKIAGYASIDKGDGMIFTSIGIKENNNASIETDASIKAKTLVNTQIGFTGEGSITFQVSAQNQGTTDAKLIEIKGLNEHNTKEPTCIKASVEGHEVGDLVYPNQVKNFTITITSTCTSYSSKEFDLHFVYEKQETINGTLPYDTLETVTTDLLNNSGDGTYNYMDGTYLKGSQDSNYVWFDGFMWRIMGKNEDGSIRMITEENVTAIPWGADNTAEDYDNSYVNDWLNNYFYSKLNDKDLLVNQAWCSQTTADNTSSRTSCTNNLSKEQKPVGLISIDENNLARSSTSYLINAQTFWTLTTNNSTTSWFIYGQASTRDDPLSFSRGVRPVVNLKSDTLVILGDGTPANPFQIQDKQNVTGELKDNSQVGEYVTYAGRNYRVVETNDNGTKLILDGYYDANNDGTIEDSDKMAFETADGTCTLCTTINEDSFINWISNNNNEDKNKLVSTTWYRGDYWTGGDYKDNLESTSNPYVGRVGLIRVGEVLSGQSETILSKNHTVTNQESNVQSFWASTMYDTTNVWYIHSMGNSYSQSVTGVYAIRPMIMIHPSISITGGQGTPNEPYTLGEAPTIANYLINNKLSTDNSLTNDGLYIIDSSGNTTISSQNPREYRYMGKNPNNYIKLNNESWRIIGIFNGKLKLIKDNSIGSYVINDTRSFSSGDSTFDYLNETYYSSLSDKSKISKETYKMIDHYLGVYNANTAFNEEQASSRSTEAYVYIPYTSDYGFAPTKCHLTIEEYENCADKNWMLSNENFAIMSFSGGSRFNNGVTVETNGSLHTFTLGSTKVNIRPVIYLNSNVMYVSGSGTSSDPYIVS